MPVAEKVRKKGKRKVAASPEAKEATNDTDDGANTLAAPGGETKKEGSMISVREAADTLNSTGMNGSDLEAVLPSPPTSRPTSAASRPTSAASPPASAASQPTSAASRPASAASRPTSAASRPTSAASRPTSAAPRPLSVASNGLRPPSAAGSGAHGGQPVSRPGSAAGHTPEIFRKNGVGPAPMEPQPGPSTKGSVASLQSKEAWIEGRETPGNSQRPESSLTRRSQADVQSIADAVNEEALEEMQHAYVPYLLARDRIAKITDDMKRMKLRHIIIVNDIEKNYGDIEEETQKQFTVFVVGLRKTYKEKVHTFRHVIDVHRVELNQKQQYWDNALKSLSMRNKQLLTEKKALLIQNKVEFDRLEKQKEEAVRQMTLSLDTTSKTHVETYKKMEDELQEKDRINLQLQEENKVEKETIEKLQNEIEELKRESKGVMAAVLLTDGPKHEGEASVKEKPLSTPAAVIIPDVSSGDKDRMEGERARMATERDHIREERLERQREQEGLDEERHRFQTERQRLQGELSEAVQARDVREAQYNILLGQTGELVAVKAQYALLLAQFTALGAIAVVSSDNDRKKVDESLVKVNDDKVMMMEMRAKVDADIETWEKQFEKENGRPPTEADRGDSVQEMYTQREEVSTMVTGLDAQIETLETLKRGETPPPPKMLPVPVKEPEVKVVEVKIRDPKLEAELETTQTEMERLRRQLSALEAEKTDLNGESSQLQSELAMAKSEIAQLESERHGTSAHMPLLVAGGVSIEKTDDLEKKLREKERELHDVQRTHQEELRAQEKAKKAIEKDVKKILKEHMKQQKQQMIEEKKLKDLLNVMVLQVQGIHSEVAAAAGKVDDRLTAAQDDQQRWTEKQDKAKQAYNKWMATFTAAKGHEPSKEEIEADPTGKKLYQELEKTNKNHDNATGVVTALEMIKTGSIPEKFQVKPPGVTVEDETPLGAASVGKDEEDTNGLRAEIERLEEQVTELEDDIKYLSSDKDSLQAENKTKDEKIEELEQRLVAMPTVAMTTEGAESRDNADLEDLMKQIDDLQRQVDETEKVMQEEREAHELTRDELEVMRGQLQEAETALENARQEAVVAMAAASTDLATQAEQLKKKLAETEARIEELEKERMKNIPVDAAKEIKQLKTKLRNIEKERNDHQVAEAKLAVQVKELKTKLNSVEKVQSDQKNATSNAEDRVKALQKEKEKELKKLQDQWEKKEAKRAGAERKKMAVLEKKIKDLELAASGVGLAGKGTVGKPGGLVAKGDDSKALQTANDKIRELKKENADLTARLKLLEGELKKGGAQTNVEMERTVKKHEKILKEIMKQLDSVTKKNTKNEENLRKREDQLTEAQKAIAEKDKELEKQVAQLAVLSVAATEGAELAERVKSLEHDVKKLTGENKTLSDNFNSERVLRKKYYNMVEDMKGKIRVYCRVRPLSKSELGRGNYSVVKSPDDYTIVVDTSRGAKDFQYDTVFMPDSTQEKVFEDTNNLIQSAVDGYNVCIFAYGQTGSGKTFTIIGGGDGSYPGIAPRAFNRIFDLLEENKSKFSYSVTCYMLELYNDKLLDLFAKPGSNTDEKMDIKKDKRGMVVISGAETKKASSAKELYALFEQGSSNRHTASTMMNAESSRSHLVIGIVIETANRVSGQILKGKLSLVDLAGSERVGKTGASAQQLKEAMSINKSLSALGDVISALSSEQDFIPYRNNKLTMLMQDSLGGNAKTLMFVNVSPADYNADESVVSLTYASRVKLITNDAQKNADNKEIARLKNVIAKLKSGTDVAVEEEV
ncbi:hypothetical protein LSAT2_022049 [Lamellibrachia satsuma]|nr:hypothetical protein LSAT2_022049 [Lamellibrachia satsuma]